MVFLSFNYYRKTLLGFRQSGEAMRRMTSVCSLADVSPIKHYVREIAGGMGFTRYLTQVASYLHLLDATFYIMAAMGHHYIGTYGTPGAYEVMRHGTAYQR